MHRCRFAIRGRGFILLAFIGLLSLLTFHDRATHLAHAEPDYDPSSFTLSTTPLVGGLSDPLFVTHAGDGSGRLFVVERGGRIRIIQGGQVLSPSFLDVSSLVIDDGGEQGLLGLAFHPRYEQNGYFFIYYTALDGANTLARYRVTANANVAGTTGEILFAEPDNPVTRANHNGGSLAFGPDGYLYIATGDGGGGGDPDNNAQNLDRRYGKVLRLNVDTLPYSIPSDNPFANATGVRREVWAYGLRNPWRMSFDRVTGDHWIGDVGQGEWEEIDMQPAGTPGGRNYGWDVLEGTHCYGATNCDTAGKTPPVHEYHHDVNGQRVHCSVTGGYVYRGSANPALTGAYLFGDFCSGQIWSLHRNSGGSWQATPLLDTPFTISSFGEGEDGELYVIQYSGTVHRLVATPEGGTVAGRVSLQGRTPNQPVTGFSNVTVTLRNSSGATVATAVTDAAGGFIVGPVAQGTYRLRAEAPGYLPAEREVAVPAGSSGVSVPPTELRAGLVTDDEVVNLHDLTAVLASFGGSPAGGRDALGRMVDLDGSGMVTIADVVLVIDNFGKRGVQPW